MNSRSEWLDWPADTDWTVWECPVCLGEGVVVHDCGIDYRTGAIMEHSEECAECEGSGGVLWRTEPVEESDLC